MAGASSLLRFYCILGNYSISNVKTQTRLFYLQKIKNIRNYRRTVRNLFFKLE